MQSVAFNLSSSSSLCDVSRLHPVYEQLFSGRLCVLLRGSRSTLANTVLSHSACLQRGVEVNPLCEKRSSSFSFKGEIGFPACILFSTFLHSSVFKNEIKVLFENIFLRHSVTRTCVQFCSVLRLSSQQQQLHSESFQRFPPGSYGDFPQPSCSPEKSRLRILSHWMRRSCDSAQTKWVVPCFKQPTQHNTHEACFRVCVQETPSQRRLRAYFYSKAPSL